MPLTLHYHPLSTFSQRVRIAADEKGLAIELVEIDMTGKQHQGAAYRALNPYGRVPTLVDGDFVLYESTAILEYLELLHPTPALLPTSPRARALVARHMKVCDLEIGIHTGTLIRPTRFVPQAAWDTDVMQRARDVITRHLRALAPELGDGWLVGDAFTLADICYAPFLRFLHELRVEVPAPVAAYAERLLARPSVRRTWLAR